MIKTPRPAVPDAKLPRIEQVTRNGRAGWLKRPERLGWRMRLQKGNARAAFDAEKETYLRLGRQGFPVPEILDEGPDFFVTAHAGPTLREMHADPDHDPALFRRAIVEAARALGDLHSHGVVHGHPALKDICWDAGRLTFIDWERSGPARNRPKDFAEDVLLFFFSVIELTGGAGPDVEAARKAYLETAPAGVWDLARKRMRRLRWLIAMISMITRRLKPKPEFEAIAPFQQFFDPAAGRT